MGQEFVRPSHLPWACPECLSILGHAKMPQSQAQLVFRRHADGFCWNKWITRNGAQGDTAPMSVANGPVTDTKEVPDTGALKNVVWCTVSGCKWTGLRQNLSEHIRTTHNGRWYSELQVDRFPFELLPPGNWKIDEVVEHYKRVSSTRCSFGQREIDFSRIKAIETLRPSRCYVGKECWLGYVAFEFHENGGVVLECPVKGNATYILTGNWKSMISLSKAEIRDEYRGFYQRVIHSDSWLQSLRTALRLCGYLHPRSK